MQSNYSTVAQFSESLSCHDPPVELHRLRLRLQILFVDRSDTVRARVATGIFERVAEWNGYGRALYPSACGVDAAGGAPNVTTTASLLAMAGMLGIRSKIFASAPEQFDYDDFDRWVRTALALPMLFVVEFGDACMCQCDTPFHCQSSLQMMLCYCCIPQPMPPIGRDDIECETCLQV